MLENVYGLDTVSGNTWYGNISLWYILCLIDSIWVHIDSIWGDLNVILNQTNQIPPCPPQPNKQKKPTSPPKHKHPPQNPNHTNKYKHDLQRWVGNMTSFPLIPFIPLN